MHNRKSALRAMALLAALLPAAAPAAAQTITGTIAGTVKDASGGVVPGVTVTLTRVQTNREETAVSDSEGRLTSVPLPLGDYRVEAALSGFRSAARTGITLTRSIPPPTSRLRTPGPGRRRARR